MRDGTEKRFVPSGLICRESEFQRQKRAANLKLLRHMRFTGKPDDDVWQERVYRDTVIDHHGSGALERQSSA